MGAIWSAIKSLGAIAGLLRDLAAWIREIQKKRALDQADETHDRNSTDIDAAFDRVPDPAAGGPSAEPPEPPAVPGGEGRGP